MAGDNRLEIAVIKELGDINERARWTRNEKKKEMRIAKWRQKDWFDSYSRKFGLSRPRMKTNEDQDAEWEVRWFPGLLFVSLIEVVQGTARQRVFRRCWFVD
jgi:hypothetical protein